MAPTKKAENSANTSQPALLIKNCNIWTRRGFREGSILVEDGKISKIGVDVPSVASHTINGRGLLALPGLIDVHVHLRDMELAYKEDFSTGTAAAAAGGFTSILDMPNSKPAVDSPERLTERMEAASRKILVNVGFHAAMVRDANHAHSMAALGAFSFKLYMPSPISPLEIDDDKEVLGAMKSAASDSVPITVHSEDHAMLRDASSAETWLALARTRPVQAESHAVRRMLRLQRLSRCSIHFAHTTLPSSLRLIRARRSSKITSEVTPHHLLLSEPDLQRLEWKAWMVPPLRPRGVSQKLLVAVSHGFATLIASDHAPHGISEKESGLQRAPPGVPGLETTLPLMLTLVFQGKISLRRIVDMLTVVPARRFGIRSKGRLEKGGDGDIVLVDPRAVSRINAENFFSKARYSPFEGFETRGRVKKTIVGGRVVFDEGRIIASPGTGRILRRYL